MNTAIKNWFKPLLGRLAALRTGWDKPFFIGLDLGPTHLNLMQMKSVAGKHCIRAIASLPYPCSRDALFEQPQKLKALLKLAFSRQPFKGRRVVSCLPADQIKIITINFHLSEGQSNTEAITATLRERLKDELDDLVADFLLLRQQNPQATEREALVALAPRKKVLAYLNLLTRSGLAVEALDIGPAAMARLISHVGALHSSEFPMLPNALLINFGVNCSYMTVIWGRRVMLDRAVEFGENSLFKRLKQMLDLPQDLALNLLYHNHRTTPAASDTPDEIGRMVEDVLRPEMTLLLQEINKTLVYTASRTRGKSVDVIYLTGPLARYPGIINSLKQQLGTPVHLLNPVAEFSLKEKSIDADDLGTTAGMALTAGLALRGIHESQ